MTKRGGPRRGAPKLEEQIAAVRRLDPSDPSSIERLREALRAHSGLLVAPAAALVAEHCLVAVADELAPAFERLLEKPTERDPGCRGKAAIVHALHALDRWDDRVFAVGLRHRQLEGYDPVDTAATLRGMCGLAHAHFGRDDALAVLVELLNDPERQARSAAAKGLGDAGRPDASALLRYKILVGDDEPDVIAACVESLLHLEREAAHDFLLRQLAEHDERAEVVALALGGARIDRAFESLATWCIGCSNEQRHRVGYLAIALLRTEPALAYLLDAVRGHARASALAAAGALATFKSDTAVAERVRAAARERGDAAFVREVDQLLV